GVDALACVFHTLEGAADGADVVALAEEGACVIRPAELEAPGHAHGRRHEVEQGAEVLGIPPADGEGGEGLSEVSGVEAAFIGRADEAGRLQAIVDMQCLYHVCDVLFLDFACFAWGAFALGLLLHHDYAGEAGIYLDELPIPRGGA